MEGDMKLYGFPMSPNTQRARFALEEIGAAYDFQLVDLMAGAQRDPAYLAINRPGAFPVSSRRASRSSSRTPS